MKTVKRIMMLLLAVAILITIPISVNAATTTSNKTTTKPSTSQTTHCTNKDNHSITCGNIEKWFKTINELEEYVDNIISQWRKKLQTGEITLEEYNKKAPTGYECWSCSYCNKWTGNFKYRDVEPSTEPSTSHTHTWDEGIITTPASCTAKGVITYHCTECDETLLGSIAEKGHSYNKTVVTPTCMENGYTQYVCSNCGDAYVSDYVNALGHSYKYISTNNGTHQKVCNNCNQITIENCSKIKDGDYEVCSLCKARYEIAKPTEPSTSHTHTWDEGTITTPATCTKKGIVTYHCIDCNETKIQNIDAKGHNYKYIASNNGTHQKVCANCDFVTIESCSKVKEGNYEVCTICKAKYEINKPTDPIKPTTPNEPSSKPNIEPSTQPTSPIEPSTDEKLSTTLKDDEKATEPSTEPTTQANKETTISVATTENENSTTANTNKNTDKKSPNTGADNNIIEIGKNTPIKEFLVCAGLIMAIAVIVMVIKVKRDEEKTNAKKETE